MILVDEGKENQERVFPDYYSEYNIPPEGAKEEKIQVYRACKTNKLDKESFKNTYEEQGCEFYDEKEKEDPGTFSVSTYEKPRDVKRFAATNRDYRPPMKIAIGFTEPCHGVVQRTKEREPIKYKKSSHVDWWLYKDARPYQSFQMIENFESYYEEYKKGV